MKNKLAFRGPLFFSLMILSFSTFFAYKAFAVAGDAKCLKVNVPALSNQKEEDGPRCYYTGGSQWVYEGTTITCTSWPSLSCNKTTCDLSNTSQIIVCKTQES